MTAIDDEKDKLTTELSEQYAQNIVSMEEYERIVEYINKIETIKEINIAAKIIQENKNKENNELTVSEPKGGARHLSLFSWRSSMVKPVNGNAGNYFSIMGANRIIIDELPKGKTVLQVNSILGLTEIIVSKKIKVIIKAAPVLAGIFAPNEINDTQIDGEAAELYITGKAVLGNITIIRK
jgi:hypothetical protein